MIAKLHVECGEPLTFAEIVAYAIESAVRLARDLGNRGVELLLADGHLTILRNLFENEEEFQVAYRLIVGSGA